MNAARWRWHALRAFELAGWPGAAALALALATAVAWLAWAGPVADRIERLGQQNAALSRRLAAARQSPLPTLPVTADDELASFEHGFAGERALAPQYAALWALARKDGVQLRQAEFRLTEATPDALAHYAMVLPVQADYRALRVFIADALRALPGLALESVELHRDDARASQLQAKLGFVLFVGPGA